MEFGTRKNWHVSSCGRDRYMSVSYVKYVSMLLYGSAAALRSDPDARGKIGDMVNNVVLLHVSMTQPPRVCPRQTAETPTAYCTSLPVGCKVHCPTCVDGAHTTVGAFVSHPVAYKSWRVGPRTKLLYPVCCGHRSSGRLYRGPAPHPKPDSFELNITEPLGGVPGSLSLFVR